MVPQQIIIQQQRTVTFYLIKILLFIRNPAKSPRYKAGTQFQYASEMVKTLKTYTSFDLRAYPQTRLLLRKLRAQGFMETNRAPTFDLDTIKKMFKAISEDKREYELMLIAFMVAARVGNLEALFNVGMEPNGWRLHWSYHKTFALQGPIDIVIPKEFILPEIAHYADAPPGAIMTEEERENIYSLMEEAFNGRTYTIRRSALQYYHYTKGMSLEKLTSISLHANVDGLKKYLASNKIDFE